MALELSQAQDIVGTIVRTIDNKATCSAELVELDQRPFVMVTLSRRGKSTTVPLPLQNVAEAQEQVRRRHQVRTVLKQKFDAMLFQAPPKTLTNVPRGSGDGFFRSSGGRGRR